MNFQFFLEKLEASEEFKDFIKENPKAYLCSGFFAIDKEGKDDKKHFDFYDPSSEKLFSFQIENGCKKTEVEMIDKRIPEKIETDFDFSFEEIESLINDKMQKENVKNKLQKIIISLQSFKRKNLLLCTVFISMLGLLKIHIDIKSKEIVLFEKKSFFDFVRKS